MKNPTVNYKSLIEWCPQAFVFADMEGTVLFANPAAHELYGYENGELVGKNVDIFNSHLTHNTEEIVEAIKETGNWSGELIQRHKDDSVFYAELSVNLVFEEGVPTGLCSYSRDISDKKEAEQKLIEQRELLVNSSRLSAIGEMAAGIAHELNNPLAIIDSKSELIKKLNELGNLSEEKIDSEMDDISETCDRIAKIISSLKTISRDSHGDPHKPIKICDVIEGTLDMCTQRFKNSEIDLRLCLKSIVGTEISGNQTQLSQVLLNLLNNAFDAVESCAEKTIYLSATKNDKTIRIVVQDSGNGVPEENIERIMQPFFTTKEVGKGTGLGLSISRRIVKDHGGRLRYYNHNLPTFEVELPIP